MCTYSDLHHHIKYSHHIILSLYFPLAIDLYFINDTPELVGGSVSAEFAANRPGLEISCHLTRFDSRQDCKIDSVHISTCTADAQ